MNITLSKKMNTFQTSIFNELSAYKKRRISEGHEIIDLSVGSPDLQPPTFVMEELAKGSMDPSQYGYSLTGTSEFKKSVSAYYNRGFGVTLQPENEVLMVMGSQDGLVHIPMVFTDPGDIILVPDPGYTAYAAGVALAEATAYPLPLKEENQFMPDLDAIPEEIREKAKLMILNFPGNPIPAMATREFYEKAINFAKKYNVIILHDFAYSELYYDEKPISFLSIEGAMDVGIEFNSMSKSFNMAGCRIGYVVGNQEMIKALDRLKSNLDYGVFYPIQKAAIRALEDTSSFSDNLRAVYKRRRDILVNGLNELGWAVEAPKASMFVWAKVLPTYTSTSFTYKLIEETGIVVTPGMAFGAEGEGYVRIGLVQSEEILRHAINKIRESNIIRISI
jgi:LL-diaminopimelate aminotransferase